MNFKDKYSLKDRLEESEKITQKYPDRIPIICERNYRIRDIPDIDKNKYLVPQDLTIGQFMYVIRKRLNLDPSKALFIYINNIIPSTNQIIKDIYFFHKSIDGFLYITYSSESSFG